MKLPSGAYSPEWLYWQGRLWYRPTLILRKGEIVHFSLEREPEALPVEGLLSPAWVNAHTHLELSHLRGVIPRGRGMIHFIQRLTSLRGGGAAPSQIKMALEGAMREGTWAFVSHQNTPLPPEALPSGVRVYPLGEYFGLSPYHSRRRFHRVRRMGYPLTPHSLYALAPSLLRQGRKATSFPRSVHFHESVEERLWLEKGRGPFRRFFRSFVQHPRPIRWEYWLRQWYRKAPAIWLVHATELSASVAEILLQRYPRLYVVLCPLANHYLFCRTPSSSLWQRHADRLLIGTDSLANAPSLSLWPTLRYLWQAGVSWEALLRAAVDTPRQWLDVPSYWVQVAPLDPAGGMCPETQARTFQPASAGKGVD